MRVRVEYVSQEHTIEGVRLSVYPFLGWVGEHGSVNGQVRV